MASISFQKETVFGLETRKQPPGLNTRKKTAWCDGVGDRGKLFTVTPTVKTTADIRMRPPLATAHEDESHHLQLI